MTSINFNKIAVLIDADNAQASKIEDILRDVSAYGRIITKRAYANWTKQSVRPWEEKVKRFAIGTIQQFDFATVKNASDMALTIDAMEMLHVGDYDCFVIVSSDSDFTALAIKLHESGVFVVGYGKHQTVESFRNACDEFNYVEDLESSENQVSTEEQTSTVDVENTIVEKTQESVEAETDLDKLLKIAEEKYALEDGFVNVSSAGSYIKRVRSDFNIKVYGYDKLPEYLRAKPAQYEVKERKGKGVVKLILYKSRK